MNFLEIFSSIGKFKEGLQIIDSVIRKSELRYNALSSAKTLMMTFNCPANLINDPPNDH